MSQKHSRLFLSCDLTGSTAFKQLPQKSVQTPWQKVFLQFYREFPQTLELVRKERGGASHLQFELWKAVGDELLFTCAIRSEVDVFEAVQVWIQTMAEYKRKSLTDERLGVKGRSALGVKGGAFIATFPGPDSESSIPRRGEIETSNKDVVELNRDALKGNRALSKYLFDFFGPSIDTGFRVLSRCDSRYFTLSLEVAFALSSLHHQPGPDQRNYQDTGLVLLDIAELKGVWGGSDYPLFAIDLECTSGVNKAFSAFDAARSDVANILALCEACYTSDHWPFKLYLPTGLNAHFKAEPVDPLADYVADSLEGLEDKGNDEPEGAVDIDLDAAPKGETSTDDEPQRQD